MDLDVEKNQSDHLQGKLDEVNVQKVEMLERDLENRKEIIVTTKKLKKALEEIKTLKQQDTVSANIQGDDLKQKLDESTKRNKVLEAELRKVSAESDLPASIALMTFKLDDAQRQLSERDAIVSSLRASNERSAQRTINAQIEKQETTEELQSLRGRVEALKAKLEAHSDGSFNSAEVLKRLTKIENELKTTRIERDQFSGLLLAEIRRTAVEDHNREHPSSAILKQRIDLADAVEIARKRAKAFLGNSAASESRPSVADLEKEIDYYLNDIVLYKLDVKGYKKDLRKVKEQIRDLCSDNGSSTVVSPT
jgi:DNA repair exonuclease SbcCD ATPase subunit